VHARISHPKFFNQVDIGYTLEHQYKLYSRFVDVSEWLVVYVYVHVYVHAYAYEYAYDYVYVNVYFYKIEYISSI